MFVRGPKKERPTGVEGGDVREGDKGACHRAGGERAQKTRRGSSKKSRGGHLAHQPPIDATQQGERETKNEQTRSRFGDFHSASLFSFRFCGVLSVPVLLWLVLFFGFAGSALFQISRPRAIHSTIGADRLAQLVGRHPPNTFSNSTCSSACAHFGAWMIDGNERCQIVHPLSRPQPPGSTAHIPPYPIIPIPNHKLPRGHGRRTRRRIGPELNSAQHLHRALHPKCGRGRKLLRPPTPPQVRL